MRPTVILGLAALLATAAAPLRAQDAQSEAITWELGGLRSAFCVQLLLAPTSELLSGLPTGYHAVPASAAPNLHVSLRSVIEGQTEFAAWSPSRLCFTTVDAVRAKDFSLTDRSGRRPQLFALWTVLAAGPSGTPEDVAIELFANSDRLIHSARQAGQEMREARLTIGKVPAEDENGVPSSEDRFQVKLGGTVVTWDGHLAGDSAAVAEPVQNTWVTVGSKSSVASGSLALTPGGRSRWPARSRWTERTSSRKRFGPRPLGSPGPRIGAGTGR
jgi:hypothetical protein